MTTGLNTKSIGLHNEVWRCSKLKEVWLNSSMASLWSEFEGYDSIDAVRFVLQLVIVFCGSLLSILYIKLKGGLNS